KLVTPYRIAIGNINIDDAKVPDDYLQEPRMTVGLVSDESLSNRLHRMSRQNRDPVIGLLRHGDTLIAERLETSIHILASECEGGHLRKSFAVYLVTKRGILGYMPLQVDRSAPSLR